MKNIYWSILLLAILAIASCSDEKKPATSTGRPPATPDTFYLCNKLVTIDTIGSNEFEQAPWKAADTSEAVNLLADSALVQRHGDSLVFLVGTDRHAVLVGYTSDSEDSASAYTYMGMNTDIGQYVVYGVFYEWYNYLLIDRETGDTTYACGIPTISPDKAYFVCGNCDIEAGFTFNGIEWYENTRKPRLVCRRELSYWGVDTLKWTTENTLLLSGQKFDSTSENMTRRVYYKLTMK